MTTVTARPNTARSQTAEMQNYLLTFMPILTEGLTEMSLHRPADPHAFLAQYLLAQSTFPEKEATCAALLEHARVNTEPLAVTAFRERNAAATKPINIIIAGAPCSGKGTQCETIKQQYGVYHLSTGDLLRAEVAAQTPLGLEADNFMKQGLLIPDELIIGIVKAKVSTPEVKARGFLLDGFPRTAVQARALMEAGIEPDLFLQLDVPDEALIRRVTGRRTDPITGVTYHVEFDPPPAGEIAARCIQRSDDTEEKITTRLAAYHAAIDAISAAYAHCRVILDGDRKKDVITKDITSTIDRAIANKA